MEYRKVTGVVDATAFSIIDPQLWDDIIKAVKSLVNHQGDEKVGVHSLLLNVGRSLEAIPSAKRAWGSFGQKITN